MDTRRLSGKKAFIAGVGDDKGFGFAIAKALAEEGADIYVGTWPPVLRIFKTSYESGKLNSALELSNGSLMDIKGIYPLDASFDTKQAVPGEILSNKRYKDVSDYTIEEVAKKVYLEVGEIDILVHSLANAPEVKKPLLETTREGYLAALSASSYSLISLLNHFGPHMSKASAALTLTYIAAEKVIPGYGGGMSSAKAALESDVRTLSYEVGRKWGMRLNAISAGPYGSRAAKAIGFIEKMIEYSFENAPLKKELLASEVAHAAAFLLSPLASAITGSILYVDNGLHVMGAALDSPTLTL